ncbi:GNAT family N-acetyltransferase [Ectobacillus ponti]|uniref:GNAT family N-acetyltransferase n=1 Tax=Ectobacillus ponti TaxID=2961894 RepID=A0AA41X880_9BACI|nr:GNAT family N-acetyltransferase [Ectobacillus ponti]MCP8968958.1 GNAT family N-acetyltransferase [Ectobacillus ponti]
MYEIRIKEITRDNWEEALKLSVHEDQKPFVPSIAESLAFAYIKPWDKALDPYVLYESNQIIGAFYLTYTPNSEENYWIGGFQVDKRLQGKGYGKQSFKKIIEFIQEKHPACKVISLTVEKENEQAIGLYEKMGFVSWDQENRYGEHIYRLKVR